MAFHNIPPNGFPDLPDMDELEAVVKDVTSLKTSMAGLATDVSNLSDNKANQITIAPFFNAETSYDPGDLVYYNGLSYRCVNAHEGEWDADDFAATTIAGELDTLKSGLNDVNSIITAHTLGDGIAVINGFTAPSDGYIIVSKGNNTNTAALQLTVGTTTVYPIVLTSATSSSSLFVHEGFTIDRYSADADATFTFYPLV